MIKPSIFSPRNGCLVFIVFAAACVGQGGVPSSDNKGRATAEAQTITCSSLDERRPFVVAVTLGDALARTPGWRRATVLVEEAFPLETLCQTSVVEEEPSVIHRINLVDLEFPIDEVLRIEETKQSGRLVGFEDGEPQTAELRCEVRETSGGE